MKHTYYYNKDYTKPIELCVDENTGNVVVSSAYWENDYGVIKNGEILFNRFKKCKNN